MVEIWYLESKQFINSNYDLGNLSESDYVYFFSNELIIIIIIIFNELP